MVSMNFKLLGISKNSRYNDEMYKNEYKIRNNNLRFTFTLEALHSMRSNATE